VSGLQHPNIAALYDFGMWQGTGYVVFEHIAGETLDTRIKGGPMPERQVLKSIGDILDGLADAHQADIVHGDIRPANIALDAEHNARVLNFGIWRLQTAQNDADTALSAGYPAPEVVVGEPATAASDIYSLGVVMFRMLTGRHPAGQPDDATLHTRATGQFPAPSTLCPGLPAQVDAIVMRALAEAPMDRFASAAEMHAAVRACLQNAEQREAQCPRNASTFTQLLRKLQQNKDFPAFAEHISEINRLTSAQSNATIVDLTNTVLKDFSLTNKLLRLVNSSMYYQFGGKVTTVSRAITIIGFENIRSLAVGLLLFDHVRKRPNARDLLEVNLWSLMAAGIDRSLARQHRQCGSRAGVYRGDDGTFWHAPDHLLFARRIRRDLPHHAGRGGRPEDRQLRGAGA